MAEVVWEPSLGGPIPTGPPRLTDFRQMSLKKTPKPTQPLWVDVRRPARNGRPGATTRGGARRCAALPSIQLPGLLVRGDRDLVARARPGAPSPAERRPRLGVPRVPCRVSVPRSKTIFGARD